MAHDFEVDMATGTSEDAPSTRGIVPPPSGNALYRALDEREARIEELEADLAKEREECSPTWTEGYLKGAADAQSKAEARIKELEAKIRTLTEDLIKSSNQVGDWNAMRAYRDKLEASLLAEGERAEALAAECERLRAEKQFSGKAFDERTEDLASLSKDWLELRQENERLRAELQRWKNGITYD